MKTRRIYLTEEEAKSAAEETGKEYYESSCTDRSIDSSEANVPEWSGEVCCYMTEDGDIFAWWE